MKSTFFLTAATLFMTAAQAQVTDTTTQQTTGSTTNSTGTTTNTMGATDTTRKLNTYGSYSTRDSIAAKYKLLPMPGALTVEKTFPILGSYQLITAPASGTDAVGSTATGTTVDSAAAPMVTITLDSASKGIVWVDGLKQGRLKAYLKKSPAMYRVVAQKTGNGMSIPEGTMMLDQTTNTLHLALGAPYNDVDPASIFSLSNGTASADNTAEVKVKTKNTKVKSKITFITATKVVPAEQMQGGQMQGSGMGTTQQGSQSAQQNQQQ